MNQAKRKRLRKVLSLRMSELSARRTCPECGRKGALLPSGNKNEWICRWCNYKRTVGEEE